MTKISDDTNLKKANPNEYTVEEISGAPMITDSWRSDKAQNALESLVLLHEALVGARMTDIAVAGYLQPAIINIAKLLSTSRHKPFNFEMALNIFKGGREECIRFLEELGVTIHADHELRSPARRIGEKPWAVKWKDDTTKEVIVVPAVTQDEAERMMPGYEEGKVTAVEISVDAAIAMTPGLRAPQP